MTRSTLYCFVRSACGELSHVEGLEHGRVRVHFKDQGQPHEDAHAFVYTGQTFMGADASIPNCVCEMDFLLAQVSLFTAKEAGSTAAFYRDKLPSRLSDYVGDDVEQAVQIALFFEMIEETLQEHGASRACVYRRA